MGSQWVQDLVRMADAVVSTADEAVTTHGTCRFCGAAAAHRSIAHEPECPVTIANTVIRQARGARQ